jgi:hypothetical protein
MVEKNTDCYSSLGVGLIIDSPREEAIGKDDRCVNIGQKPLMGCAVQLLLQDLLVEAVVDSRTVMGMLGTEQYSSLGCKPPIKCQVSLLQAGSDDQLRGLLAGPIPPIKGEYP